MVCKRRVLNRSGNVVIQENTWNMSYTDTGTTSSLSQSPLRSPTVFNFFYPGYEFPGALASAGLTTPEFQLTTDSGVAAQMNFIEGGILNNTGNTNGLSSFTGGNGSIVLDIDPWMTTNYTVQRRHSHAREQSEHACWWPASCPPPRRRTSSATSPTRIIFPTARRPPQTQMRDRVRAVDSSDRQFARLHHPKIIL